MSPNRSLSAGGLDPGLGLLGEAASGVLDICGVVEKVGVLQNTESHPLD